MVCYVCEKDCKRSELKPTRVRAHPRGGLYCHFDMVCTDCRKGTGKGKRKGKPSAHN